MRKRENWWKIAISSVLVLTLVATGVAWYTTRQERDKNTEQDRQLVEDFDMQSQDVSNHDVIAEDYEQKEDNLEGTEQEDTSFEVDKKEDSKNMPGENSISLNFHEDSVLVWPVNGKVLIDYSMETTTYFQTLDQYKCSNGIVLGCEVGTAVQAACNGKIVSILENEETGMTVTMDIGNGYRAIYGQLRGLRAKVGDTVEQGVIFGYVEEPSRYFVKEGANLYFSINKDGEYVDPMLYLETVVE